MPSPNQTHPNLLRLIEQLWPSCGGAVRCRVEPGGGQAEPDSAWRPVETYAIVPSLKNPRFLVPLPERRAAANSLLSYPHLRRPSVRMGRRVFGQLFRAGVGGSVMRGRLIVEVVAKRDPATWPDVLLVSHLSRRLGGDLVAGIGVHHDDPNRKPTVQLFDRAGRPVAYAKVGIGAGAGLVRAEEKALQDLPRSALDSLGAPRLIDASDWNGCRVICIEPLAPRTHFWNSTQQPGAPWVCVLPRLGSTTSTVEDSDYLAQALAVVRTGGPTAELEPLTTALGRYLEAVRDGYGTTTLPFGAWHGDWVRWNVGTVGTKLSVWDWEHARFGVPWGFDQAHWIFQTQYVRKGAPLSVALAAVREDLADALAPFGGLGRHAEVISDLYAAELAWRVLRLYEAGGGWDPVTADGLVAALGARAASIRRKVP